MIDRKIAIVLVLSTLLPISSGGLIAPDTALAQGVNAAIAVSCGDIPGLDEDAPAQGTTLNYAVVTNNQVTATEVIQDDAQGAQRGWNPDGLTYIFTILNVPNVDVSNSVVLAHTNDPQNYNVCAVNWIVDMAQLQQPELNLGAQKGVLKPSNMTSQSNVTSQ